MPSARGVAITAEDLAFLSEIHSRPDDDAPRFVYADALMERGDPRGELIQLQCELARVDEDDERWHRMKRRERAILKEHQASWTTELRALGKQLSFEFHRGFVELAQGPASELARVGAELLAAAPLIRRLDAHAYDRSLDAFVESRLFASVDAIRIGSWRRRVELSSLANLEDPIPLLRLELEELALAQQDIESLASSRALSGLRELAMNRCVLGKATPAPLEGLRAQLERFAFMSGKHPAPLVRALARGPAFANLKALILCNNPIGDDGLTELVNTGRLHRVEELDLRSNDLSAKALSRLLDGALPARGLRRLLLGGNEIDDALAAQIAQWPGAAGLEKLDLGSPGIGNKGVLALAASPHLTKLRSLVLTDCRAKAAAEGRLAASPHLARARLYVGSRFLKRS